MVIRYGRLVIMSVNVRNKNLVIIRRVFSMVEFIFKICLGYVFISFMVF